MIISSNPKPPLAEFQALMHETTAYLNQQATVQETYFLERHAQKLEDDVMDALVACAQGTAFENTIQKISGQKFPDIIAAKYYGVEVKSAKDTKWVTLGGSVNESTRVNDVERIFLMFGQLIAPIRFMCRPYEDCLSDVVVTHYPRYKIDMQLGEGQTIFDKMGTTYDALRTQENPVREIVQYYKQNLRAGESLWWIDNPQNTAVAENASITVKLWRTLSPEQRDAFIVDGLILFPEIFGDSISKYERFSLWLVTRYGVVSTSTRDAFSAGGKQNIITSMGSFENLPQVISKVNLFKTEITKRLLEIPDEELLECWNVASLHEDRLAQWITRVCAEALPKTPNIYAVLTAIYNS